MSDVRDLTTLPRVVETTVAALATVDSTVVVAAVVDSVKSCIAARQTLPAAAAVGSAPATFLAHEPSPPLLSPSLLPLPPPAPPQLVEPERKQGRLQPSHGG